MSEVSKIVPRMENNLSDKPTHKNLNSKRETWFQPILRRMKQYAKDNFKSWYLDYEEVTKDRVYLSCYVEQGGKSLKVLIVGKKLHPKFDVYNNPK
jgi:transposase-like protein